MIKCKKGDVEMEPYKAKLLPISYKLDRETIKLLGLANDKYGQYKSLLKMFKFDQKFFLDSLVLGESIRSSRIEGTQISQDDMYYMNYKESNDSIKEVTNLKKMLDIPGTVYYNAIENCRRQQVPRGIRMKTPAEES